MYWHVIAFQNAALQTLLCVQATQIRVVDGACRFQLHKLSEQNDINDPVESIDIQSLLGTIIAPFQFFLILCPEGLRGSGHLRAFDVTRFFDESTEKEDGKLEDRSRIFLKSRRSLDRPLKGLIPSVEGIVMGCR